MALKCEKEYLGDRKWERCQERRKAVSNDVMVEKLWNRQRMLGNDGIWAASGQGWMSG